MTRRAKATAASQVVTPLRQARLAIPATMEEVCTDLDRHAANGSSGVTPSMLSGWKLGRHITSIRYRKMLADYYGQRPEVLFAHQDAPLTSAAEAPRLLVGHRDLREAMTAVADGAQQYLAISGSRSRDIIYLEAIEAALAARPELVHYRVLFGPPRHPVLTDHLLRLLELRDPADRSLGKTLHIGMVADDPSAPRAILLRLGDQRRRADPLTHLCRGIRFRHPARREGSRATHRPRSAVLRRRPPGGDYRGDPGPTHTAARQQ